MASKEKYSYLWQQIEQKSGFGIGGYMWVRHFLHPLPQVLLSHWKYLYAKVSSVKSNLCQWMMMGCLESDKPQETANIRREIGKALSY